MLYLTQSVDAIESVRETISLEAAKIGFAGDKQAVYGALATQLAANEDWTAVFRTIERAKARALVDLLAQQRNLAAPAAANEQGRGNFSRERRLGRQASAYRANQGGTARHQAGRGFPRSPDWCFHRKRASLISVQKVEPAEVRAHLAPEETLVDYYASGDDLFALVLDARSIRGFRLSAKGLDEEVRAFRASIEQRDPDVAERAQALYAPSQSNLSRGRSRESS
ncbi:MAG: hypothetical protein WDM77_10630 [Steroidobacteraceae bacterium]